MTTRFQADIELLLKQLLTPAMTGVRVMNTHDVNIMKLIAASPVVEMQPVTSSEFVVDDYDDVAVKHTVHFNIWASDPVLASNTADAFHGVMKGFKRSLPSVEGVGSVVYLETVSVPSRIAVTEIATNESVRQVTQFSGTYIITASL